MRARATGSGLPVKRASRIPRSARTVSASEDPGRARQPAVEERAELDVPFGRAAAPGIQVCVDRAAVEAGVAEDEARDPFRRLPGMVDVLDRILGKRHVVDLFEGLDHRTPEQRVVGQEEHAVDIEEHE
jgi:hypothetical protein